ncbi:MAG: hypothetical protein ABIR25_05365 [Sphingomicrobium sp.]
MRNPTRKIVIYLALVLLGVALAKYGIDAEKRIGEAWTSTGFSVVGMSIVPIAFILLIRALFNSRGRAKLLACRDVIAHWHLTADEWERFRTFDRIRGETNVRLFNDLAYDNDRQHRGIDVIVGKKSALVGDSYHVLRKGGIPGLTAIYWLPAPADPECLEFHIVYPRHRSPPVYLAFRFPFPAIAQSEARRVYNHFEPMLRWKPALALRRPGATIRVALVVAAVCASAFIWGLSQAKMVEGGNIAPLIAAIFGAIVGVAALILALITAILSRRKV